MASRIIIVDQQWNGGHKVKKSNWYWIDKSFTLTYNMEGGRTIRATYQINQ